MSFRARLEAKARGDLPTTDLLAFGGSNSDAYDLQDNLPNEGIARLAAWCAFVLQTYGDKLLSSGATEGYASAAACSQAQVVYELARGWLGRAQQAAADPGYVLDVTIPQLLPHPMNVPPERDQIAAMRATLETVQARAGAEVGARQSEPVGARLTPMLAAIQTALDSAIMSESPGPDLRASLGRTLGDGLDRAYSIGQLLAVPSLLAAPSAESKPVATSSDASIGMFLPGDPGFDPWCLTDPLGRSRIRLSTSSSDELDALWKSDPDPGQTLALQADIASAIAHGSADYLPSDEIAAFESITGACPWPGVLLAREPIMVGETLVGGGQCFVLDVGGSDGAFRRGILKLQPDAPS